MWLMNLVISACVKYNDNEQKNVGGFENFKIDASTEWTPGKKKIIKAIARAGVERFVEERRAAWTVELAAFFQAMLAVCAGVREEDEKKRRWNLWGGGGRIQTPGLWDAVEAFANDVDAVLEKWDAAFAIHYDSLKKVGASWQALPKDALKLLKRSETDASCECPPDYLAAECVAQGQGFKGKGRLGGNPFYDLAFVVAAASRNKNAADVYDALYQKPLKRALNGWACSEANGVAILKTSDFENWYDDLKQDVLYDVEKTKSYAGKSGLASYLATICINECRKKLKRGTEEKKAGVLRLSQVAQTQGDSAPLLASVRRNVDDALRELAPWSGFTANVRRRAYALHLGPSRPGEAALIGEKARQYATAKDAGKRETSKAELDDLTRTTKLSSKAIGLLLDCSHSRVESLFAGVQNEVLNAVAQAYKDVCGAGGTSLLRKGIAFYRAAEARAFCEAMEVLERVAADEDVALDEMNEALQNSLEAIRSVEAKAIALESQAEGLKKAESARIADLETEKKEFERELENASDQEKERWERERSNVKQALKEAKARRDGCDRIVQQQKALLLWLSPARDELERVDQNAGWERKKNEINAALEKIWEKISDETYKKVWKERLSFSWRDSLSKLWGKCAVDVAHNLGDTIAVWLECVERINPETGEYRSFFSNAQK